MDLWIRSQDKKHLMKCEAIMHERTGTGFGIRVFTKNYDFNIANYKTNERALEILDEISDELISANYMPLEENEKITCGSARIYEMPKE